MALHLIVLPTHVPSKIIVLVLQEGRIKHPEGASRARERTCKLERLTLIKRNINNERNVGDFFPTPETTKCSGESSSSQLNSF